jgi:hypothetical protein
MTEKLVPEDAGYDAALAALLAKAQRLNPRLRLAEPWERACLDPRDLYSFSDKDGCMIAPIFVLDDEKEMPTGEDKAQP